MIKQITMLSMVVLSATATSCMAHVEQNNHQRYSQAEPGVLLRSPKKLLVELKLHNEKHDQYDWAARCNNPKEYQEYVLYGKQLLEDALITHTFLSSINKNAENHEKRIGNFNRFMYSWKKSDNCFRQMCNEEYDQQFEKNKSEILRELCVHEPFPTLDLLTINNLQEELIEHIMALRANWTYYMLRQHALRDE